MIVVIALNRPEKRNPITEEMLSEFEQIVTSLRDDPGSRAVILTGTGNSFCAGAELWRRKRSWRRRATLPNG